MTEERREISINYPEMIRLGFAEGDCIDVEDEEADCATEGSYVSVATHSTQASGNFGSTKEDGKETAFNLKEESVPLIPVTNIQASSSIIYVRLRLSRNIMRRTSRP